MEELRQQVENLLNENHELKKQVEARDNSIKYISNMINEYFSVDEPDPALEPEVPHHNEAHQKDLTLMGYCPYCKKTFDDMDLLFGHIQNTHPSLKPY